MKIDPYKVFELYNLQIANKSFLYAYGKTIYGGCAETFKIGKDFNQIKWQTFKENDPC